MSRAGYSMSTRAWLCLRAPSRRTCRRISHAEQKPAEAAYERLPHFGLDLLGLKLLELLLSAEFVGHCGDEVSEISGMSR